MKIIFVALGSYGDLIPMLNAAVFAADHGFQVELIAYPFFMDFVQARSKRIKFIGVCTVDMYKKMVQVDKKLSEHHIAAHHFISCSRHAIEPVFAYIEAAEKAEGCIVVGYTFSPGAAWAARKFNIPYVRIVLSSADLEVPLSWNEELEKEKRLIFSEVTEIGEALYRKLGMSGPLNWLIPFQVNLCFFPEVFVSNADTGYFMDAGKCDFLGFMPKSYSSANASPDRQIFCNGHEYFLYTSGTVFTSTLSEYLEFSELCETFDVNGLFVSQHRDFDASQHFRSHIQVVDYCDLPDAIRGSKLVISHGGIGTVAGAMLAAVPQLVAPKAFDQFHNARLVNRLGFGLAIEPENFSCKAGLALKAAEAIKMADNLGELIGKYKLNQFRGDVFLNTLINLSRGRR